jgi:hypothetical protein
LNEFGKRLEEQTKELKQQQLLHVATESKRLATALNLYQTFSDYSYTVTVPRPVKIQGKSVLESRNRVFYRN